MFFVMLRSRLDLPLELLRPALDVDECAEMPSRFRVLASRVPGGGLGPLASADESA